MGLAMRLARFSRASLRVGGFCGSEWTAAVRFGASTVALLAGACQRRLSSCLKGLGKVGSFSRERAVIDRVRMARGRPRRRGACLMARVPLERPVVDCGGLRAGLI